MTETIGEEKTHENEEAGVTVHTTSRSTSFAISNAFNETSRSP